MNTASSLQAGVTTTAITQTTAKTAITRTSKNFAKKKKIVGKENDNKTKTMKIKFKATLYGVYKY